MREIKFRAWDGMRMNDTIALGCWRLGPDGKMTNFGNFATRDYILMQYTGLKDKNGVEIYEDDILSGDYPDEVIWDGDRGQWMLRNCKHPDDTVWEILRENKPEIIGNIYENPELREEKR